MILIVLIIVLVLVMIALSWLCSRTEEKPSLVIFDEKTPSYEVDRPNDFIIGEENFTLSFTVNTVASGKMAVISSLSKIDQDEATVFIDGGKVVFYLRAGPIDHSANSYIANKMINDGENHVVVVERKNSHVVITIDEQILVNEQVTFKSHQVTQVPKIEIGSRANNDFFKGKLSNLKFGTRAIL